MVWSNTHIMCRVGTHRQEPYRHTLCMGMAFLALAMVVPVLLSDTIQKSVGVSLWKSGLSH